MQKRRELNPLAFDIHDSRLESRKVEQVGHEPREALGLAERDREAFGRGGGNAVDHIFELAPQCRDGRAQFMGDVGDEVSA